jgi:site-specific recombinase XerD
VNRDSDTGRHLDLHLQRRFAGKFGGMRLDAVTPDMLRNWLDDIVSEKTGEKLGTIAKRQHRKDLNVFFVRAIREGWVKKNPCELVDLPEVPVKDVQILTVDQAKQLLFANRKQPIAARLALEMFGGLRAASAERIKKDHIDFEARGIRFPGGLHKGGKTLYRQGQPDVLWQWLKAAPETCWTDIDEGNYGAQKSAAVRRAFGPDFTMPHNALRHSFASYHLAAFKSIAQTGYLMQHTNGHTTGIYEGVAREAEAKKYFSISPSSKK